jgi:ATPase subunit of ABC transporter with duplicated ATPase domains
MDLQNASAVTLSSNQDSMTASQELSATRVMTQTTHATHNAVKAEDLSVFIGARCLLANAELKIAEQSHQVQVTMGLECPKVLRSGTCHGLVGVNGCGKSTLLRIIAAGEVPVPPSWDVFLVSQHLPTPDGHSPVDEVLSADAKRTRLMLEQVSLEEQMAILVADDFHQASARLLELHSELCKWDGAEEDVIEILVGLGFRRSRSLEENQAAEPTIHTPMNELSGGWRMKVQLAKGLWLQPKLLLLDEPTNHLDFRALQWLREQLEQYPHTTVVVSHDVSFLHDVCREILWMKDLRLEALPRDMVSQEDLLRMQRKRSLAFHFTTPEGSVAENHGLSLHGVEFSYPVSSGCGRDPRRFQVKKEVRFSGSSRAVLLGKNGSGKSTFLDLCAGKLTPSCGSIDRTHDLKIGHYSQLTEELDQNSTDTAASYLVRKCSEELASHAGSTRTSRLKGALASRGDKGSEVRGSLIAKAGKQQKKLLEIARGVLSRFGFEGDVSITVPVDRLSGGQKALLKIAVLTLQPAHILFLDEPTNHLDAEACEALAKALSEFKGGIVAVTHDELLIYRLIHCNWSASELLICRGGTVSRTQNFGASCLSALKGEVHRAEEVEALPNKTCEMIQEPVLANRVVTKNELPPWLQQRRPRVRAKDKPPDSAPDVAVNNVASEVHVSENVAQSQDTGDSDASTDIPESSEEAEAPHEEDRQRVTLESKTASCPEQEAAAQRFQLHAELSLPVMPDPQSGHKEGRHSRLRKDIVNLNKAVKKWLRKEEQGDMTRAQVIENVMDSVVARKLRETHGEAFEEVQFVEDVLKHAEDKGVASRSQMLPASAPK